MILYVIFLIAYYLLTGYMIFGFSFMGLFGAFNVVMFEWGRSPVIIIFALLAVLALTLPIWVRKIKMRNRVLTLVISFLVILVALPKSAAAYVNHKYSAFSYKEWNEHPAVRRIMYNSLIGSGGIEGKTSEDVRANVGEPDSEKRDGEKLKSFDYKTSPGTVSVFFNNNTVSRVEYNPFQLSPEE